MFKGTTMKCIDYKTCIDFDDADNICHNERLAKRCSYRLNDTQHSKTKGIENP